MTLVPYTCPTIDKIIDELKRHKSISPGQAGSYYISAFRMEVIVEMIEEVRSMNAALRYDAKYWKKLCDTIRFGAEDYNPEVLPQEEQ
jgi:hypothetical protein